MTATVLPLPLPPFFTLFPVVTMRLSMSLSLPLPFLVLFFGATIPPFFPLLTFVLLPSLAFSLTDHLLFGTPPRTLPVLTPRISPLSLPVAASLTAVALNASYPLRTVAPLTTSWTLRLPLTFLTSAVNWMIASSKKLLAQPSALVCAGLKKERLVLPISSAASGRVPLPLLSPFSTILMVLPFRPILLVAHIFSSILLLCVLPLPFTP